MRRSIVLGVLGVALLGACAAHAQIAGNPHVDPEAPCFRWPATDMDGDGVFDRIDHCPNTAHGCTVDHYGCGTDSDDDGVCDGVDRCSNTPYGTEVDATGCPANRSAATQAASKPSTTPPPPPPPPMKASERQLLETGTIRLENLYFERGSSNLLPESESALQEAIETLEKYPRLEYEVQGHTDTRGAAEYNQRLSQSRADAVRMYIMKHSRLEGTNLHARGYGESQPETAERNEEEFLRNRRVVIKVLNPEVLPKGVKVENKE